MLTVLVAFAWMCWVITFALLLVSILFAAANSAFFHPLHGRYDPHASFYRAYLSSTPSGCPILFGVLTLTI